MKTGKVYLVGAGPGDEKLITIRGMECLQAADVVVYDRLANPRLLKYAGPDTEFIYCGKLPKRHTLRQESINTLLVEKALEGKSVVRLKGGDPGVFGRVGEEAAELAAHGVEYEIIPGITAGIAAPIYAGIPVTHREYGTTFAIVTGHDKSADGKPSLDWAALAAGVDTIAFYMGIANLPHICEQLIAHGRAPETPIALIRWGTMGRQKTLTGTLASIVEEVDKSGFSNPAIILVGEIVRLRETISWFEKKPLFGQQILLARTGGEPGRLADMLMDRGADVIEYPAFSVRPLYTGETDAVLASIAEYDEILFTSPESVDFFFQRLRERELDIRAVRAHFYTLSERTKRKLWRMGFSSANIEEKLSGESALIIGEKNTVSRLNAYAPPGGNCKVLAIYEKKEAEEYSRNMIRLLEEEKVNTVVFPSAASVHTLISSLTEAGVNPASILCAVCIVCMGEKAAAAVEKAGYRISGLPDSPSPEDLIQYLQRNTVRIR